jgi:hypothetical protein
MAVSTARVNRWKAQVLAEVAQGLREIPHGTERGYMIYGCRRSCCRAARRAALARRRRRHS